jgi:ABC-type multidrug transport system fused ATPase/permease subunit
VEEEKAKMTVSFRRIAALALPEVPMLAFAMIMLLLSSAMLLVVPILFGLIIQAIREGDNSTLMKSVVGLLVAAGGGGIVVLFRALGFQLAGQRVAARLRIDLYKSIIRQDVSFFDSERVGEIANRISTDTQVLQV